MLSNSGNKMHFACAGVGKAGVHARLDQGVDEAFGTIHGFCHRDFFAQKKGGSKGQSFSKIRRG